MIPRLIATTVLFLFLRHDALGQARAQQEQKKSEGTSGFHLTFDNIAGALGIVFGAIGLIAFLDQRRTNRAQEPVIGYIKRNMTKDVSEATIAALSEQLRLMEKQTKEEMPKLARRAVLLEQSQRLKEAISDTYTQWKTIESELGKVEAGKLYPELENAITDRMLPSYLSKMKTEANQQRLTIGASAIALCSFVLPYPIDTVVGFPLALWLIPTALQLINDSGVTEGTRQTIYWIFRVGVMAAIFGLGGFAYSIYKALSGGGVTSIGRIAAVCAAALAVLLLAAAIPIDRFVRRWCRENLADKSKFRLTPLS